MLLYRFIDLTLSNMGLIFTEHLICFSHCSKCFICMDSFNLNSLVVIIPHLPGRRVRLEKFPTCPKWHGLRAEEPHSAPAECALSVTEWMDCLTASGHYFLMHDSNGNVFRFCFCFKLIGLVSLCSFRFTDKWCRKYREFPPAPFFPLPQFP